MKKKKEREGLGGCWQIEKGDGEMGGYGWTGVNRGGGVQGGGGDHSMLGVCLLCCVLIEGRRGVGYGGRDSSACVLMAEEEKAMSHEMRSTSTWRGLIAAQ